MSSISSHFTNECLYYHFGGGVYLKKMKILAYCLTAIALLLIISHSASAGYAKYYPSENIIQVYSEPNGVNFTWLDSQINNQSLLFNDGGDIWYLNATLSLYQSKFYINNTDVSKLILGSAPNYGKLSFGHPFYINNVEITGGDMKLEHQEHFMIFTYMMPVELD